jgi:hypothetical protein
MASSTYGEFGLQNLLLLGVRDVATVKRAAAGWGGDRWALYAKGDARLFHLSTTWDSEAEAQEFWDIYLRSLNSRSSGRVSASASQPAVTWEQSAGKALRASISGRSVSILVGTDAAALQAAWAALGLG